MKIKNRHAYLFLLPFIVFIALFYIIPAILTVAMSFTSLVGSFIWKFSGLDNHMKIFKDPNTFIIIKNTFIYVGISAFLLVSLSVFFSVLTTYFIKNELIGSIFKSILMLPMITPAVVYSVMIIWLFEASETGLANQFMMKLGNTDVINWIAQYPFQVVIGATVLSTIAYSTIVFSGAVQNIPTNHFKAARIDGVNEVEIVKSIILLNLWPHVKFILIWETLGLLTNYVIVLLITNGGPGIKTEIWALSAYHKAFVDQKYGYGAAISVILIVVILMAAMAIKAFKSVKGFKHESSR